MALRDRLAAIEPSTNEGPVEKLLKQLDPEDAKVLKEMLNNKQVSTLAIHLALKDEGFRISRESVSNYRRKNS